MIEKSGILVLDTTTHYHDTIYKVEYFTNLI